MSAKVIQVIESITTKGNGTKENPTRKVKEYYSFDGEFLADNDQKDHIYNDIPSIITINDLKAIKVLIEEKLNNDNVQLAIKGSLHDIYCKILKII